MYKKIKNGSFMNLIWVIIALAPFIFLIFYTLSFYNVIKEKSISQKIVNPTILRVNNEINYSRQYNWTEPKVQTYALNNATKDENNYYNGEGFVIQQQDAATFTNYLFLYVPSTINLSVRVTLNDNTKTTYTYNFNENTYFTITTNNYKKVEIWSTNYNTTFKLKTYFSDYAPIFNYNDLVINANYIGVNLNQIPLTINNVQINGVEIELPTSELYSNDYIDFENKIYTQNGIENSFEYEQTIEYNNEINITYNYNSNIYYNNNTEYELEYKNYNISTYNFGSKIELTNIDTDKKMYYTKSIELEYTTDTIQIYTSLSNYLNDINNTLKTNGFISNAFLNLAQFFGVTNVYYSLACYYIEYLLIIVLLHLAFDVLYMLPNICHKFMEKLGGERD